MSEVVYLQLKRRVHSQGRQVPFRELGRISCSSKTMEHKIRNMTLPSDKIPGPGTYVFSVIDVISRIEKDFPKVEIQNLGETDFILTISPNHTQSAAAVFIKVSLVCLIAFWGAAFSIMAFHNDVGVTDLFHQLYYQFTGRESDGFTILEISYSIGIGCGILLFYHHFSGKKSISDPTPLEVELCMYETDVDTAVIDTCEKNKMTGEEGGSG